MVNFSQQFWVLEVTCICNQVIKTSVAINSDSNVNISINFYLFSTVSDVDSASNDPEVINLISELLKIENSTFYLDSVQLKVLREGLAGIESFISSVASRITSIAVTLNIKNISIIQIVSNQLTQILTFLNKLRSGGAKFNSSENVAAGAKLSDFLTKYYYNFYMSGNITNA